jgi:cell division septum initiation protein DivIVA
VNEREIQLKRLEFDYAKVVGERESLDQQNRELLSNLEQKSSVDDQILTNQILELKQENSDLYKSNATSAQRILGLLDTSKENHDRIVLLEKEF